MLTYLNSFFRAIADTLFELLLWPATYSMSQLSTHTPAFATWLGGEFPPIMLALTLWALFALSLFLLVKLFQNFLRIAGALIRTFWHRVSSGVGNYKTMLVCRVRRLLPHRKTDGIHSSTSDDIDDLDLAVLRAASASGPAHTLSARELADKFTMRPAQVQLSLDKLNRNRMLDPVIGSKGRFGNYRLTDAGATYLAMWQRRAAV